MKLKYLLEILRLTLNWTKVSKRAIFLLLKQRSAISSDNFKQIKMEMKFHMWVHEVLTQAVSEQT